MQVVVNGLHLLRSLRFDDMGENDINPFYCLSYVQRIFKS